MEFLFLSGLFQSEGRENKAVICWKVQSWNVVHDSEMYCTAYGKRPDDRSLC